MKILLIVLGFCCGRAVFSQSKTSESGIAQATLRIWERAPGLYKDDVSIPKKNEKILTVASETQVILNDIQYQKKMTYKGEYFLDLVERSGVRGNHDMALLHFQNGMLVPFPLDASLPKSKTPFIAVSFQIKKDVWSPFFPNVERPHREEVKDPRPLLFEGNKIAVSSPWHPLAVKEGSGSFTPWAYADSIVGIELVQRAAYERQFAVADSSEFQRGMKVFIGRCQYCHSVRKIGSTFGWDYVDPLPVYKMKRPENLFFHVKVPKMNAVERGLMMPAQKDLTEKEAKDMWEWLRLQAEKQQKAYSPN